MKRKRVAVILFLLFVAGLLFGYEQSLIDLKVPSGLQGNDLDLLITHRFYGDLTDRPFQTLFGLSSGANVGFGARFMTGFGFQFDAGYVSGPGELEIGLAYRHKFPRIRLNSQLAMQYLNFETPLGLRDWSLYGSLSLQTEPLFNFLVPAVTAGYDLYFNRLAFAAGLIVNIGEYFSLLGEFYPAFGIGGNEHAQELGQQSAFAAGMMLKTYGHHFVLLVGNSEQIGQRRLMAGTSGTGLHLGFNIQRHLIF